MASRRRPRYFSHVNSPKKIDTAEKLTTSKNTIIEQSVSDMTQDDKALYNVIKYCFLTVSQVMSLCQHVPVGFPHRLDYLSQIAKYIEGLKLTTPGDILDIITQLDSVRGDMTNIDNLLWKAGGELNIPINMFLMPRVQNCIMEDCSGTLFGAKSDVCPVTVFTMTGPVPALKATLHCRKCQARYGIGTYKHRNGKSHFYPESSKPTLVTASNKVYLTDEVFELLCESGNHGFVSAQAFSEIYVSVFHSKHPQTRRFIDLLAELEDHSQYTITDDNTHQILNPFLTRKSTLDAFFNGELENEVRLRDIVASTQLSSTSSREDVMHTIDLMRRTEIYPHPEEHCSSICKARGCEHLRVIDSCWKLCIPHCMMSVPNEVQGFPLLTFPNVCTAEPAVGSVFCTEHHELLERNGVPTDKKSFLQYIGCKENPQTAADISSVDKKVVELSQKLVNTDEAAGQAGTSSVASQGIQDLVDKIPINVLNSDRHTTLKCNKDTGEKARLRQRARGHFAAVTGGGNILCFNPIFKSESPSQVFMLSVQMIAKEIEEVPAHQQAKWLEDYVLCYDNMCNLDKLAAANEDLPLPGHLAKLWSKIKKIIDRLHLKNHKNELCHEIYNPDIVLDDDQQSVNTMAAEQLFSWMSRFKKIVNSMTQTHHLFYLHRMCRRRNSYTAKCRKRGVEPVLPGLNKKFI